MADKIVIMRAGRIEQVGSPMELYHRPVNSFVGGFIGSPRMNILPGHVVETGPGLCTIRLSSGLTFPIPVDADGIATGDSVSLGVRPEHVALGVEDTDLTVRMKVYVKEPLGGETILYGHLGGGQTLVVKTPGEVVVDTGRSVRVAFDPTACHLFAADGAAYPRPRHRTNQSVSGGRSYAINEE